MSPFSADVSEFAQVVQEALRIAKGPDFFRRRGPDQLDEFRVLRRWNSHSPSLLDVWGGGYFMRWRGKGTVIDPGVSFLRLLNLNTPYGLRDLNMVVATHDHFDHCGDLGTLISLLRAYNDPKKVPPNPKHTWDLVVSHGVADQLGPLLVHPENAEIIHWRKSLPPQEITSVSTSNGSATGVFQRISDVYSYELETVKAFHNELLGERTGFGVRITLDGNTCIVISSDTAVARGTEDTAGSELADGYRGANLLVLHVGTMEKPSERRLKQHLGFAGVVEVLSRLAGDDSLQLVVLSEWGYEFGRLGLRGRSRFTKLVVEELERRNCNGFFAAVEGVPSGKNGVPILPADLNLRIRLPDFWIWPDGAGDAVPAERIRARESVDCIHYVALDP